MTSDEVQLQTDYNKVGGWLLLFCVSLTMIGPILTVREFFLFYMQFDLKTYFLMYPSIKLLVTIDTLLSFSLMIFSIYTGVALWSYRKNAVLIAKVYLIVLFLYAVFLAYLPYAIDIPVSFADNIKENTMMNSLRLIGYCVLWFAYLLKSKRVKYTYELTDK